MSTATSPPPSAPQDATFHPESAYGSPLWAATVFGRSVSWFRDHRSDLDIEGFPRPDPITGYWIKADVRAWIDRRRRLPDAPIAHTEQASRAGARLNAL